MYLEFNFSRNADGLAVYEPSPSDDYDSDTLFFHVDDAAAALNMDDVTYLVFRLEEWVTQHGGKAPPGDDR